MRLYDLFPQHNSQQHLLLYHLSVIIFVVRMRTCPDLIYGSFPAEIVYFILVFNKLTHLLKAKMKKSRINLVDCSCQC